MRIYAVIGLGYVGLGLAVALSKKNKVFGLDINPIRISNLKNNIDTNQLIEQSELTQSKVIYTDKIDDIKAANFYIVSVATPAFFYETPNLKPLIMATNQLGEIICKGDIIVFESTVYPGTSRDICIPILEKVSHLKEGSDFHVGYSPERINPGDKIHTLRNTTKIISASNEHALSVIEKTYLDICDTVYPVSSLSVAEAIKVLENTQRDINIALMNEFSKIAHALNLDMHEIIAGASTKWSFVPFKPGFVGGHCISIDSHYLAFQAKRHAVQPDLILTARKVNDGMTQFVIQSMLKLLIQHNINTSQLNVGIFGVSYKENTNDLRNSLALKLIKELHEYGFNCRIHDPMNYSDTDKNHHHINMEEFESIQDLSVIIMVVGHDYYRDMGLKKIVKKCKNRPVMMDIPNLFIDEFKSIHELIYWNL